MWYLNYDRPEKINSNSISQCLFDFEVIYFAALMLPVKINSHMLLTLTIRTKTSLFHI